MKSRLHENTGQILKLHSHILSVESLFLLNFIVHEFFEGELFGFLTLFWILKTLGCPNLFHNGSNALLVDIFERSELFDQVGVQIDVEDGLKVSSHQVNYPLILYYLLAISNQTLALDVK